MSKGTIIDYINEIIGQMEEPEQSFYRGLSDFCLSISLKPKKVYRTNVLAIDYINKLSGQTIVRFGICESGEPLLKLRFFANENYSKVFWQALYTEIESCKGKWKGCHSCGKEQGQRKKRCHTRYMVQAPDGKSYVRCGYELVSIVGITLDDLLEVQKLILAQDEFYNEGRNDDEFVKI